MPAATSTPTLSLCMIVRNERAHLAGCLDSVKGLVGEIVVVDTGSTDGTREIARALGARVVQSEWRNDFAEARNVSLSEARGKWILVLDADERLLPRDREAIAALMPQHTTPAGDAAAAFNLILRHKTGPEGGSVLQAVARLFPNRADIRYVRPVHEEVATSIERLHIPTFNSPIEIQHLGYLDPERNREKQRRNLAILRTVAEQPSADPKIQFFLGGAYLDLGDLEGACGAYRECLRTAAPGDLSRAAAIRVATCLVRLKRPAEAIAMLASTDGAGDNPEAIVQRAEAEEALGRPEDARRWHERVLTCSEGTHLPICDLSALKAGALRWLAEYWRARGKPALGLSLLRAAVALHKRGVDPADDLLARMYRDHAVSPASSVFTVPPPAT